MMLQDLIPSAQANIDIKGLSVDSRSIKPGFLFAALPGSLVDGRRFIDQAIDAGAVAILAPEDTELNHAGVILVTSPNPRLTFAKAAARFYGRQPEHISCVTGTNGKSSTVTFVRQFWQELDIMGASLGTLGVQAKGLNIGGHLTTPDPAGLHQKLSELSDHGITHLAMEASSHGLDQYRLDGVHVGVAAFTNLSRDHLDYHKTMDNYLSAKARLFKEVLCDGGTCVLNADIPEFGALNAIAQNRGLRVIDYGTQAQYIKLVSSKAHPHGQDLELEIEGRSYPVHLPLAGAFQIENALCALGIVLAHGIDADKVVPLLSKLEGVPGRLELIGTTESGAGAYVDYAHTPDALETVLQALRPHTLGKLHVVFGCGGDRDRGKRPEMGRVACEQADVVYVTDDNPRTEDADLIRKAIVQACPGAHEIADRKTCIEQAVGCLQQGDILVVAGKGHETGQIIHDRVLPFDDRAIVRETLS